uniref:SLAM family member 9-like n=1 Tax=Poecilia reticulata TaxID=8081 RepID=A0A3P9QEZ0_POERE
ILKTEGPKVFLNGLIPVESQHNARVVWTFGVESPNIRIASVKQGKEVKHDYEEKFRARLLLDSLTGALTISQLETSDSGVYQFQSISSKILSRDFHLTVYSFLPAPSITVTSSVINSSSAAVTVECSVQNSRELKLSWYRGTERLKQTSSPSLPTELTLSLEVDAPDGDDYSCVAENPVERQTTKLHTKDIQLGNAGIIKTNGSVRHTSAVSVKVLSFFYRRKLIWKIVIFILKIPKFPFNFMF